MTVAQIEREALQLSADELRQLIAKLLTFNLRRDGAAWREIQEGLDDKALESWTSLRDAKKELLTDVAD